MDDKDLYNFYAGMALVGILSNGGPIDRSAARAAHMMACEMVDLQMELSLLDKEEDKNGE